MDSNFLELTISSDYLIVSTGRDVKVSVLRNWLQAHPPILISEQAPTMNTMVPVLQCATVFTCASLKLQNAVQVRHSRLGHRFATNDESTNRIHFLNVGYSLPFPMSASSYLDRLCRFISVSICINALEVRELVVYM